MCYNIALTLCLVVLKMISVWHVSSLLLSVKLFQRGVMEVEKKAGEGMAYSFFVSFLNLFSPPAAICLSVVVVLQSLAIFCRLQLKGFCLFVF